MTTVYKKITEAAALYNKAEVKELYEALVNDKKDLDVWFDEFLKKAKGKTFEEGNVSAQRKLYDAKLVEFDKVNELLKIAKFYAEKLDVI